MMIEVRCQKTKCKHAGKHTKKRNPRYRNDNKGFLFNYVISQGLEPRTLSLEGRCSIQLSYETIPFLEVQRYTLFLKAKKKPPQNGGSFKFIKELF